MHSVSTHAPCVLPKPEPDQIAQSAPIASIAFDAMGCQFEILIDPQQWRVSDIECAAICEELRELVLDWHYRLSVFEPGSLISQINRAREGSPIRIDEDMFELLELCQQVTIDTKGVFNIASGTLMCAHGFRDQSIDSIDDLSLDNPFELNRSAGTITKTDSRISIDFGAIAKGHIIDLIRDELDEMGISNAFVHGGTSSAFGIGYDHQTKNRSWSVLIGDHHHARLDGYSLGVSELDARTVQSQDQTIEHIMDPRTMGTQDVSISQSTITRSVCIHKSAARADAYSTACTIEPSLANDLIKDPCSIVLYKSDSTFKSHDPLGVVQLNARGTP